MIQWEQILVKWVAFDEVDTKNNGVLSLLLLKRARLSRLASWYYLAKHDITVATLHSFIKLSQT